MQNKKFFRSREDSPREDFKKENFIYGLRPIIEALNAGKEIEKLLVQQNLSGAIFNELKPLLKDTIIPIQYVPIQKLDRLTMKNHQGVIAFISEVTFQPIDQVLPMAFEAGSTPLFLVLDRVTDVRNFGAIARTAECAGANAIIIPSRGSAPVNSDAMKTSAGALNTLSVCREVNLKQTLTYLKDSGVKIVACSEKATKPFNKADLTGPVALLMGSEEDGISSEYLKLTDEQVCLPIKGSISSLNVSVAAGILLYEVLRQREDQK